MALGKDLVQVIPQVVGRSDIPVGGRAQLLGLPQLFPSLEGFQHVLAFLFD